MKQIWCSVFVLVIFIVVSSPAYSDIYWEDVMETGGMPQGLENLPKQAREQIMAQSGPEKETLRHYLTDHAFRTDTGNAIVIIDFDTMTVYNLDVRKKTYSKTEIASVMNDKMGQALLKGMTQDIKVTPTDETREIAGYPCKKYVMTMMGQQSEYWLSKDVEGYKEFRDMTRKLEKIFEKHPVLRQTSIVGMMSKLDGFPVKTVMNMMGMNTVTTLKKIEKKSLDKSLFKVPKGYKREVRGEK